MSQKLVITEEQNAKLDWAFKVIAQFMLDNQTATVYSKEQGLVVTDINDCVYPE